MVVFTSEGKIENEAVSNGIVEAIIDYCKRWVRERATLQQASPHDICLVFGLKFLFALSS